MRSGAGETSGSGKRARVTQVVARWLSVGSAARRLDVSETTVRRLEAAGAFGDGNSAVIKAPGSRVGELRIRAVAVNAFMERMASEREMDRQAMAENYARTHPEVAHV